MMCMYIHVVIKLYMHSELTEAGELRNQVEREVCQYVSLDLFIAVSDIASQPNL